MASDPLGRPDGRNGAVNVALFLFQVSLFFLEKSMGFGEHSETRVFFLD
jgi:hypothetical protein